MTISQGIHMKAEILDRPEIRVAAVHHAGAYNRISNAFARLGEIAGPAGLFHDGARMIAIFHDDPKTTPEQDLRSEAGLSVGPGVKVPTELTEVRIPAGTYARTLHKGTYEGLPDAWARMMAEWLPQSGKRRGNGVSYELYLNDPTNTPPEGLLTEICIPLA